MEIDYKPKRNHTRREMLELLGVIGGGALMVGSPIYMGLTKSPEPLNLARYTEIERKLKSFPKDVTLENLESESPELIARANKLMNERDRIESTPGFAKVRKTYKSERDKAYRRRNYSLIGGGTIFSLSLGAFCIRLAKEMRRSPSRFRAF